MERPHTDRVQRPIPVGATVRFIDEPALTGTAYTFGKDNLVQVNIDNSLVNANGKDLLVENTQTQRNENIDYFKRKGIDLEPLIDKTVFVKYY